MPGLSLGQFARGLAYRQPVDTRVRINRKLKVFLLLAQVFINCQRTLGIFREMEKSTNPPEFFESFLIFAGNDGNFEVLQWARQIDSSSSERVFHTLFSTVGDGWEFEVLDYHFGAGRISPQSNSL